MSRLGNTEEELEIIRESCRKNLKYLCTQFLGYSDWDSVHDAIARILYRPSRRKLILVPRGHLKSSIITKAFAIQTLLEDPNKRILISNQVWDKAREMLSEIKEFLTTKSHLPALFGKFESARWNADEIAIRQRKKALSSPSIGTTGTEAETTSSHYDLIIADDLHGLQNVQTKEQRDKVKRYYRSLIDLLEPAGCLILVGTRWHLDDLYQDILDQESMYFDILVRSVIENGKLIFPNKFNLKFDTRLKKWTKAKEPTMDFIDHLKKTKGSEFYSQYMNNPIDEENQMFKSSYFRYWDKRPDGLFLVLTLDPAIGMKESADSSALVVTGMEHNHAIYVMDYLEGQWTPAQILDNLFMMQDKWKPHVVGLENFGFQRTLRYMATELMHERKQYFSITEIKTSNRVSKEFKMKALEPFYKSLNVYHASWMKGRTLEHQLLAFPRARHDDLMDALSMSLDLLHPGSEEIKEFTPSGSWEAVAREARKLANPYRNFFYNG